MIPTNTPALITWNPSIIDCPVVPPGVFASFPVKVKNDCCDARYINNDINATNAACSFFFLARPNAIPIANIGPRLAKIESNAYVPEWIDNEIEGINYRLNTTYKIKNDIRQWNKVNVKYIEKYTNKGIEEILQDEDGDNIYFYSERMPNGV